MNSQSAYDEDVTENPFYSRLQNEFSDVFETATLARCIVCVPRISTIKNRSDFSIDDFRSHILQRGDEDQPNTFKTLNDKTVLIVDGTIQLSTGFSEKRSIAILFEETFFNANNESYDVLCVSGPFSGEFVATEPDLEPNHTTFHYLSDCEQLLWRKNGNQKLGDSLNHLQQSLNAELRSKRDYNLQECIDISRGYFKRGVSLLMKDQQLKRRFKSDSHFRHSALLALESYLLFKTYKTLYAHLCTCLGKKDARLNKLTRNLRTLQLRDLSVRPECCQNVPRGRKEIASLTRFTTPTGKINCLYRVFKTLQRTDHNNSVPLTSDDLLSICIFLVVKTDNPHWWATFAFMTDFRFSQQPLNSGKVSAEVPLGNNSDEFSFCLATLEAALEHVSRKQVMTINYDKASHVNHVDSSPDSGKIFFAEQKSKTSLFFELVRENDVSGLQQLCKTSDSAAHADRRNAAEFELCHPLCSCERCKATARQLDEDRERQTLDLHALDDRGLSALHIAAANASKDVTDFLLASGVDVNTADVQGQTALHVACAVGKQKSVLNLLHQSADGNALDNHGNSPLHEAVVNGHEDCVKALVYFDRGVAKVDPNIANEFGDRPLHLASKYGYLSICYILLDNGAIANSANRKHVTPVDLAHNLLLREALVNPKYAQAGDANAVVFTPDSKPRGSVSASSVSSADKSLNFPRRSSNRSVSASVSRESVSDALHTTSSSDSPASSSSAHVSSSDARRAVEVDKLLRAVHDRDLPLVRFLLSWSDSLDGSSSGDDLRVTSPDAKQLCHPLCQCDTCRPLQTAVGAATLPPNAITVNSQNASGTTALHQASQLGFVDFAKLFIRNGAHVNAAMRNGETPLHAAIKNKQDATAELLLKYDADTNMRDARGNTPLHVAALTDNEKMIAKLIDCQANMNVQNARGNTPLHEAARASHVAATRVLVTCGCDVSVFNRNGQLPVETSRREEIQFFLRHAQALRRKKQVT